MTTATAPARPVPPPAGSRHRGTAWWSGEPIRAGRLRTGWTSFCLTALARALLALTGSLVLWSLAPAAVGWQSSVVMTGSMAPALVPGDVAVVRPADGTGLRRGHVLLVDDPDHAGRLRLHRLVGAEDGGLVLKGDANRTVDSTPVDRDRVHGIGVLRIPLVGLPYRWVADGELPPLLATGAGIVALFVAAGWHHPAPDRLTPGRPTSPAGDRNRTSAWRRRSLAVTGLAGLMVTLQLWGPAMAGYTGQTSTSSALAANSYYRCLQAAGALATTRWFPLQETAGTTAGDQSGNGAHGTYQNGPTLGATGPNCGAGGTRAVTLNGTSQWVSTAAVMTAPTEVTVSIWFRTTTVAGGRLIGLGNRSDTATVSTTNSADRHLYMGTDGRVGFGVIDTGLLKRAAVSTAAYNDGAWHLATGVLDGSGIRLYVDGVEVAASTAVTSANARTYAGAAWRIGWDRVAGFTNAPTNLYFGGSLAHATVHPAALAASEILAQYRAGA